MARERKSYRKPKKKYNGNVGALLVVVVLLCFLTVIGFRIQVMSAAYHKYETTYAAQIRELEEEERRGEELMEQKSQVRTDEDIEKIAREQLGLIKPGEILLRPNK